MKEFDYKNASQKLLVNEIVNLVFGIIGLNGGIMNFRDFFDCF